jgi:large subunit ribosomal protein L10
MENPRPEKVAVVDEVKEKFESSDAALLTEYRGLTVRDLAQLRSSMREAGGEYRVYKNTLVRLAAQQLDLQLGDGLVGPTAIAFVGQRPDGSPGDAVMVAKALQAFAKANPLLVVKGGLLGDHVLDAASARALADVAPREELLARLAGGMAAPMREFASLLQAVPAKMAYALQALIDAGGAPGAPGATADAAPAETAEADEAPAAEATDVADATDDAADAATTEAPAADAAAEEE